LRWVGAGLTIHSGGVPAGKGNDMTHIPIKSRNPIRRAARALTVAGAIATGLTMTATTARAGSITFSDILSPSSTTVSTASIQKFDTALGTLDKVQIQYDLNVNVSALFRNHSFTPQTTTLASNLLRLNGNNRDIFDTSLPFGEIASQALGEDIPIPGAFAIPNSTVVIPGSAQPVFGFDYMSTFDSDGLDTIGTFFSFDTSLFEGTGDFDFDFTATLDSPLTFIGFQPFLTSSQPNLSGTVTVTYEFTEAVAEIPAPAALPALATGLAAFGLLRRRHHHQRQNG
tara:strand:+ start:400 stop:1254 length:855 start_codon:yes stop_codon:yes gene_type:complete